MKETKRTASPPLSPPVIVPEYSGTCMLGWQDIFKATIRLNVRSYATLLILVLLTIVLTRLVYFDFDLGNTFASLLRNWSIVLFTVLAIAVGMFLALLAAARGKGRGMGTLYYAFDRQGLCTACTLFTHQMRWEYFAYWREVSGCIGLGTGGRHLLLPEKAFSPEAYAVLRDILKEKLPQK